MRIAYFLDRFPVISETFILRQITGMLDLGHEVVIFAEHCPDKEEPVHAEVESHGLFGRTTYMEKNMPLASGYWEMPVWPLAGKTWLPGAEKPLLNAVRLLKAGPVLFRSLLLAPRLTLRVVDPREYGYQARSLSTLYRLATIGSRPTNYDVLHAHFGPVGNMFRFARSLCKAPMVVSFHGYDYTTWPRHQGHASYRRLFDTVDAVTVNSDYARNCLTALGCLPSKITRLAYGVSIDDFVFQERKLRQGEPVRMLTVARLVEKKGLEYAIRAIGLARERYPNLHYDIVGEGPLRPALEGLIRRLSLEHTVTLHGARDGSRVRRLMTEAHLFLLSSVTAEDGDQEGTPVSLIEAQACGLPVLSSFHSGIPEIVIDGQSGFLVAERDVVGLAERLIYLVSHPEIWPGMGREGRRNVETHHDIRRLNGDLDRLYREVIGRYKM